MSTAKTDVLVIGAGPVGLAVALGCAERGLRTRVVERGTPPLDKACGEGIMPDGVARLRRLGVDPVAAGGRPFLGIRYLDGEVRAEARFGAAAGVGIRRTRLAAALVERARGAGVALEFGLTVRGLTAGGVSTDRGELEADIVVGADGLRSRVRRWSGLDRGARGERFGVRRHYCLRPWSELVEVHWGDGCEAYVTPVGDREVGVAILWRGAKGRFDALLERFPSLVARLRGAEVLSPDRGAGPLERRVRGVVADRVALVGDAAGYIDAITGEGLSAGFAQAEALTAVLAAGRLDQYAAAHRRLRRLPALLVRSLLAAERRPALRRRLMRSLAADPLLFKRLLALHSGEQRPSELGVLALADLGRRLLSPATKGHSAAPAASAVAAGTARRLRPGRRTRHG
jgi:flavin-dependent dehydrogenase